MTDASVAPFLYPVNELVPSVIPCAVAQAAVLNASPEDSPLNLLVPQSIITETALSVVEEAEPAAVKVSVSSISMQGPWLDVSTIIPLTKVAEVPALK